MLLRLGYTLAMFPGINDSDSQHEIEYCGSDAREEERNSASQKPAKLIRN